MNSNFYMNSIFMVLVTKMTVHTVIYTGAHRKVY